MILIGLGANLPNPRFGSPRATLEAALRAFPSAGISVRQRSRWYQSAPLPAGDQPWYVNGVARVETALGPGPLLAALLGVEADFGRRRGAVNAPRTLDLDLLAHDDLVSPGGAPAGAAGEPGPILPHPRLSGRAFVLLPLAEVAPGWRHPVSGRSVEALIAELPEGQEIRPLV